jgi:hypothetical protein
MQFPPINLFNAPRQVELEQLLLDKALLTVERLNYTMSSCSVGQQEQAIKDREFLYYCHTGQFPDYPTGRGLSFEGTTNAVKT